MIIELLSDHKKENIQKLLSVHETLNTGKPFSDESMEEYVRSEYTPIKIHEIDDNNFFTYKEMPDYIWIQDFISVGNIKAYRLLEKIESFEKKVMCQVPWTNLEILNTIIRKGFKLKTIKGYNYILERC